MFVTPEQYLRFLRRRNRDQPLTEDERDFLRMDEERKILQHYQDPANLAPVATGVGAAVPPTVKPNVPTMRDRLEGVTNADEARQVLDGADDSQLAQLMNPLNRNLRGTGVVYGRAGERPMFTDSRGELHEGSSWTPHRASTSWLLCRFTRRSTEVGYSWHGQEVRAASSGPGRRSVRSGGLHGTANRGGTGRPRGSARQLGLDRLGSDGVQSPRRCFHERTGSYRPAERTGECFHRTRPAGAPMQIHRNRPNS